MIVNMERSEKEKLFELFAIIAEQIGMIFERIDDLRVETYELHERVDLLTIAADMDKADLVGLEERVNRLET